MYTEDILLPSHVGLPSSPLAKSMVIGYRYVIKEMFASDLLDVIMLWKTVIYRSNKFHPMSYTHEDDDNDYAFYSASA